MSVANLDMADHIGEPPRDTHRFTDGELEIIRLIVAGHSNREIGEAVRASEQTVKNRLRAIFDKAGTDSRLQLALLAVKRGWVELEA